MELRDDLITADLLEGELAELVQREGVLMSVLSHSSGESADDIQRELWVIRKERKDITHRLSLVRGKQSTGV